MKERIILFLLIFAIGGCGSSEKELGGSQEGSPNAVNNSGPTSGSNNYNGAPSDDGTALNEEVGPEQEETSNSNYFYFSYDDSASTASVDLVKYQLHNGIQPDSSLSRPWEFLNFETFSPDCPASTGLFTVSMGLWNRQSHSKENATEYRLGVYVAAPEIAKEDRDNAVLTIIVDVSGSMDANILQVEESSISRLDLVKYGLLFLKDSLKEGDIVNLVTFSTTASVILQNASFTDMDNSIIPAINNLETLSSTNLNEGIEKGYAAALATYDPDKMNRVLILTDAWANTGEVDPKIISQHTRINEKEGIYFSGLGISADFNESFLNELTDAGKGAYFSLITKNDARRAFSDRFSALLSIAAKHVIFKLINPEGMEHIHTASEESSENIEEILPTNFSYNTNQYFYEAFSADSDIDFNDSSFTIEIIYQDPASGEEKIEKMTKTCSEILSFEENNIRDAEIIFLLNELIAGRVTKEEIDSIIDTFYLDYSSGLFNEYDALIELY